MSVEVFEKRFEVESPAQLKVGNIRGHVDVTPGDDGLITVKVEKHENSVSAGKTEIIVEQQDDGMVVAEAKYENSVGNLFGLFKPSRVDFTIQVPRACSVKVNCVSSSARVFCESSAIMRYPVRVPVRIARAQIHYPACST